MRYSKRIEVYARDRRWNMTTSNGFGCCLWAVVGTKVMVFEHYLEATTWFGKQ